MLSPFGHLKQPAPDTSWCPLNTSSSASCGRSSAARTPGTCRRWTPRHRTRRWSAACPPRRFWPSAGRQIHRSSPALPPAGHFPAGRAGHPARPHHPLDPQGHRTAAPGRRSHLGRSPRERLSAGGRNHGALPQARNRKIMDRLPVADAPLGRRRVLPLGRGPQPCRTRRMPRQAVPRARAM